MSQCSLENTVMTTVRGESSMWGRKASPGNKNSASFNTDLLTMATPEKGNREIHFLLHTLLWCFPFVMTMFYFNDWQPQYRFLYCKYSK